MSVRSRDKKGAIFIDTGGGHKKIIGYRATCNGIPGIAYVKEEKIMGFKSIAEVIRDISTGYCLNITTEMLGQSGRSGDTFEK